MEVNTWKYLNHIYKLTHVTLKWKMFDYFNSLQVQNNVLNVIWYIVIERILMECVKNTLKSKYQNKCCKLKCKNKICIEKT